ncbi:cell envelope biogenesis protein AsmA [Phyllobacterium brassicacearum]|uniref:Cell envelope biogenesis protein AsmA n=1 Tax=Phyllobacterium brassicacearum TaxID=314235 RepID=A0A2P7BTZ0_9HYPH|nr:cell envelope biogenesis protein AsmA [Phyllobacterium brassicacearum]
MLVLVLTAALVVPYFVDWAGYRSSFEREASALLGRPVTVAGSASARLLPFPSVTFSDVKVGDPGTEPVMTIDRFSMDAELAPFIRGQILIFDMRLEAPIVSVAIDKDGVVDWAIRPHVPFRSAKVRLEDMRITDGSVVIRDASTATTRTITELDATLSAADLSGPWKFDGTLLFNGEKTAISAATGEVKPDGTLKLRTRIIPDGVPGALETDGDVTLNGGALKYAGSIAIRSADELVASAGTKAVDQVEKPLLSSLRVTGRFEADHGKINIPEFRMEQGAPDDPYVVNGNALFDYGSDPRFEVRADGQQVTFDNGKEQANGTKARAVTAAARLGVFRRLMDQLPIPTIPGTIDLKLPAIVAGDTTIRSVAIDAAPSENGWTINQLKAELPGRTQFEANGVLQVGTDFGFDGKLLVASRQPSGLAAWLTDSVDESIRRLPGAGFSGDVSLRDELQKVDNLELALGGSSLKGSLVRSAKGESLPLTQLTLEGGALDADALAAFAAIFGNPANPAAGRSPQLQGQDLDVHLKAGPVTHDGLVAESLDTAFRLRDGVFDIDRLTIGNVAGATITATGKLDPFKADPTGSIDSTILADDLAPFISALATRIPDFPFIKALNEHAANFPGLFQETQLTVLANTLRAKAGTDEFSLSAAGKTGGMDITLSGTTTKNTDKLRTLELTMNARSGQAETLMALIGLPSLPLGLAGELEADLALKGNEKEGLQTQLSLKATDGQALVDGGFRDAGDGLTGEGRASIKTGDLEGYLATAGYSLPGFGNGMPADLASSFQLAKGRLTLPDLSGQLSGTKVSGRLGLAIENDVPVVQGDVKLARLDLPSVAQFVLGGDALDGDGRTPWPKQVFAAAPLFPVSFNVKVTADEADAGVLGPISQFQTNAALKDGALRLDEAKGDLLGGRFDGMFELRNTSGTGLATGQFTLDQTALDALYKPAEGEPPLKGKAKITASVNATGTSVAEMMESVAGSGVVSASDLTISAINPAALKPILADADAMEGPVTPALLNGTIGKYLHAGTFKAGAAEFAFTIAGGMARTSTFQLGSDGATLAADLRLNFPNMTVASQGRIAFDPGTAVVAGADPVIEFTLNGPWDNPKLALNRQPLEQFLTQRALEREQQRVETLQAALVEKQRLRRETQLYQARADERVRLAEEARLKAEQEAREAAERAEAEKRAAEERAAAEKKAAEDAAAKALEQSQPATPQPDQGGTATPSPGAGTINKQSVDEFLKTLEPKSLEPNIQ